MRRVRESGGATSYMMLQKIMRGRTLSKRVSKYKAVEFQIFHRGLHFELEHNFHIHSNSVGLYLDIFGFWGCRLRFARRCDHAGFHISLLLMGLELLFDFYDIRHWDDENNYPINIE